MTAGACGLGQQSLGEIVRPVALAAMTAPSHQASSHEPGSDVENDHGLEIGAFAMRRLDLRARLGQNVVPGAQMMQRHPVFGQPRHGFGKDAVVEDHGGMAAGRAGLADRVDEAQFRSAVGRQILDQQHALAVAGPYALPQLLVTAVALEAADEEDRLEVVDLDVHDGNGTRSIFANDTTTYTYSVHNEHWGETQAVASTSVALGAHVSDRDYLAAVRRHVSAALH